MRDLPCFAESKNDCPGIIPAADYVGVAPETLVRCDHCYRYLPAKVFQQVVSVSLTADELAYADAVGAKRNRDAKARNLPDAHGYAGHGSEIHALGARAELAFAKYCGVTWDASNLTFKAPDVGCAQVKGRSRRGYELIVRDDDSDELPFVLVVGTGPEFFVVGWTTGALARQAPRRTHGGREEAHFVPHVDLFPPSSVRQIVAPAS